MQFNLRDYLLCRLTSEAFVWGVYLDGVEGLREINEMVQVYAKDVSDDGKGIFCSITLGQ